MDRRLVRAAMAAEGMKYIGILNDYDGDEYGNYIYTLDDSIVVLSIGEDEGEIEEYGFNAVTRFCEYLKEQMESCRIDCGEHYDFDIDEIDNIIEIAVNIELDCISDLKAQKEKLLG